MPGCGWIRKKWVLKPWCPRRCVCECGAGRQATEHPVCADRQNHPAQTRLACRLRVHRGAVPGTTLCGARGGRRAPSPSPSSGPCLQASCRCVVRAAPHTFVNSGNRFPQLGSRVWCSSASSCGRAPWNRSPELTHVDADPPCLTPRALRVCATGRAVGLSESAVSIDGYARRRRRRLRGWAPGPGPRQLQASGVRRLASPRSFPGSLCGCSF